MTKSLAQTHTIENSKINEQLFLLVSNIIDTFQLLLLSEEYKKKYNPNQSVSLNIWKIWEDAKNMEIKIISGDCRCQKDKFIDLGYTDKQEYPAVIDLLLSQSQRTGISTELDHDGNWTYAELNLSGSLKQFMQLIKNIIETILTNVDDEALVTNAKSKFETLFKLYYNFMIEQTSKTFEIERDYDLDWIALHVVKVCVEDGKRDNKTTADFKVLSSEYLDEMINKLPESEKIYAKQIKDNYSRQNGGIPFEVKMTERIISVLVNIKINLPTFNYNFISGIDKNGFHFDYSIDIQEFEKYWKKYNSRVALAHLHYKSSARQDVIWKNLILREIMFGSECSSLIEDTGDATIDRLVAVYNRISLEREKEKTIKLSFAICIGENFENQIEYIKFFACAAGSDKLPEIRKAGTSSIWYFVEFDSNLVDLLECLIAEYGYMQADVMEQDTTMPNENYHSINGVVFKPGDKTLQMFPLNKQTK